MKKIVSFIMVFVMAVCVFTPCFAAEEYTFDLQYTGKIEKNIEKDANVLLVGNKGTLHSKALIKIAIEGPATPKILATDTNGSQHDIAQLGYWGPPEGFPVQGDFTNTTPVKATFTEAGKYKITLSLVDLEKSSTVIATKTFEINVTEKTAPVENNTVVDELPKTGIGIGEYALYTIAFLTIATTMVIYLNNKRIKENG